jgi:outer membrane protein TolC
MQAPVPAPATPVPDATHPLAWSPDLPSINHFVASRPITMQEAVSIGLYTNRSFALAMASLEEALGRTGEAKAALMPNMSLNGQLNYYSQPEIVKFGAMPILVQNQFNPVYTAAFNWPLDVVGALRSAVSQAQFSDVAARIDVNRVRNQIVFDVKSAFYNVLRSEAQVGVTTNNLNNALVRLGFADKNYAAGTSARFDVLTAQRDVADAQQALITAKAAVATNLAMLKNTMGLDLHTRMSVTGADAVEFPPDVPPTPSPGGTLSPDAVKNAVEATQPPPLVPTAPQVVQDDFNFGPDYDALLKEALDNRPELLETAAQVSAAQHGVRYAARSWLPSFSIGLDYVYTPNAAAFVPQHIGVATLNINLPIWDGGLASARVREARASAATADINRRTAHDQVVLDVQQAYITLVQARQRVAVAKVEVAQAEEALRVGRVRFQAGVSQQQLVSPQLELSNSQTSLTQAQANQVDALYDYNTARAQLDRALGRYGFTGQAPGYAKPPLPRTTGQKADDKP